MVSDNMSWKGGNMNGVVEVTGSLFQAGVWIVGMAQSELFVSFYLVVKFDAELPTMCRERISRLQTETVRGVARIFSEVTTILQIAFIIIRNNVEHAFE